MAPLHGLFVREGIDIDLFKAGLLMSPLLCVYDIKLQRLRSFVRPLLLLVVCGGLLFWWQVMTGELAAYEPRLAHQRMATGLGMWLLRILTVGLIVSLSRGFKDLRAWGWSYVAGVLTVCVYGLMQQGYFLWAGDPITPIYRDGLLGASTDFSAIDVGGLHLLRIHSLSREPKDLALFCCPAIGWLISQTFLGARSVRNCFLLGVVLLTASLTFSSSFLLILPLILLGALSATRLGNSRLLLFVAVLMAIAPLIWKVSEVRVFERFTRTEDLLQESRERPALQFMKDRFPRSLLGFGVGSQAIFLPSYMPRYYSLLSAEPSDKAGMDSLALTLLVDLGVSGVLLALWIALRVLRSQQLKRPRGQPFRAAFWSVLVASLPLNPDLRNAVLWLFLGLACAAIHHQVVCTRSRMVLQAFGNQETALNQDESLVQ